MASSAADASVIRFGPFPVSNQVFLKTRYSFALVNLMPIIPGHTLVCPLAPHLRLTDLSADETADLFSAVKMTQRLLARAYLAKGDETVSDAQAIMAGSFTVAVQDGPDAGQTVPHVHVHVIPRVKGDMEKPDDIYVAMAGEGANVGGALWDVRERPKAGGDMPRIEDMDRTPRAPEDMESEAIKYRDILKKMGIQWDSA